MLKKQVVFTFILFYASSLIAQNPIVQFVVDTGSASEGADSFGVYIYITNPNANQTQVDINVLPDGTAQHGVNYTYSPVTATFPGGSPFEQLITIYLYDDSIQDGNKFFVFKLANPTNGATIGPDSEFIMTITNDDTSVISFMSDSFTVPKDTGIIYLPVNMSLKNDSPVSVQVKVVPGGTTAVPGVDYTFNDTIITWAALTRGVIQVPVTILNDTLIEPNKVVRFTLVDPTSGAVLTDSAFTLTIRENDIGPPVILQFSTATDTVADPDSTYTLYPVSVQFYDSSADTIGFIIISDLINSTAIDGNTPPADYSFGNQPFGFIGPGAFTYNMSFPVFNDPRISPTKKAIFRFIDVSGNVKLGPDSVFTLYITNQNKLTVSFLGAGDSYPKDTALVMVPVVMSTFPPIPISVDVSLAPSSAIYGQDFTFNDTTVIFPAYSTDTQGVWVNIIDNSIYQGNKQVNFNLSDPTNGAILGISGYTLTIINDDSLLGISPPDSEKFSIFPDPTSNTLFIQSTEAGEIANLTNTLGQVVLKPLKLQADRSAIDISSLQAGIYIISITSKEGTLSRRFVKSE